MNKRSFDKLWLGLIMGLLLPMISSYAIFKSRFSGEYSFSDFLVVLFRIYSIGKLISISVLSNLLLFFIVIKFDVMKTARGIVVATALYALALMILFMAQ